MEGERREKEREASSRRLFLLPLFPQPDYTCSEVLLSAASLLANITTLSTLPHTTAQQDFPRLTQVQD